MLHNYASMLKEVVPSNDFSYFRYASQASIEKALSHDGDSFESDDGESHTISVELGKTGMRRVGGGRSGRANRRLVSSGNNSGVAQGRGYGRRSDSGGRFAGRRFAGSYRRRPY
ncbi:hypothetical protein CTI12_AA005690 [Artemisia annua]|uniref:Uncharacterized protein n=1 Tax=Artemisia annua TaxID=35608 RepID=A0A2U1QNK1_ARTAN|nr:hypothetical protein CTI12_AA005690 [Artemisia annua]